MHVFAYGSLLWNPGFTAVAAVPARLHGWRRSWCVASKVHRGTPDFPGLVLGLVEGGSCGGILYEVCRNDADHVRRYLDEREMAEEGYLPAVVEAQGADGSIKALTYVADPMHSSERGSAETIYRISKASGVSGSNLDYALKTIIALGTLQSDLRCEHEIGFCSTNLSTLMAAEGIRWRNTVMTDMERA